MRIPILVLIVLGVLLAIYFVAAGADRLQGWKMDAPDPSHPDAWNMPPLLGTVGDLAAPFAPHASFAPASVLLGPAGHETLTAAAPTDKNVTMQVATFAVSGPGALGVIYACTHTDGTDCSQSICLCQPGAAVSPALTGRCPQAFRDDISGGACPASAKPKGSLVIYPEARAATAFSFGPAGVQATVK